MTVFPGWRQTAPKATFTTQRPEIAWEENTRFTPENGSFRHSDRFPASPHLRIEGISLGSG
jgi:hypothetical protein